MGVLLKGADVYMALTRSRVTDSIINMNLLSLMPATVPNTSQTLNQG